MSLGAVLLVICGCHGQRSFAQSGLPRDPSAYFPKNTISSGSASSTLAPQGADASFHPTLPPQGVDGSGAKGSGSGDIRPVNFSTSIGKIGEPAARILAIVNGVPLVETELAHAIFPLQLAPIRDADSAKKRAEITQQYLDRLIDVELLTQDMNQRFGKNPGGRRTLDKLKEMADKEFEGVVRNEIRRLGMTDEEEYRSLLGHAGLTYEGKRDYIQRSMIADEYARYLISTGIEQIGQRQLYEYYREHPDEFTPQVDNYEWEDIFLDFEKYPEPQRDNAKARAIEIVQRLRAGAKIAEMLEFDDGDSRSRNGRGEGAHRGQIQPPTVEPVLITLKDGEIGPLVITQTGIHIVRMVHRENAHELQPFDAKLQKLIREKLQQDIGSRERKRVLDNLRRKAHIEFVTGEGR
jgi:hypothetical protein